MEQSQLSQDIATLKQSLGPLPEAVANPAFVIVSGLPGTGKTFFCRKLAERIPFCILESDALRKVLFPAPDYSAAESARLFTACHNLIERLLKQGIPIILDATNLSERNREHLYRIGDRTGAKMILVRVEAPPAIAYQRLQIRKSRANPEDKSDADWEVYRRMKPRLEKIRRNHFAVDTSRDITPVIDKIVRLINRSGG
ncbi:MAG TPA: ATP-binding protein [Dehalococcoidia bacterium]|nr:ATP-binding protein [Dehalococcoidia bacterium]